jgi:hypothetical protein
MPTTVTLTPLTGNGTAILDIGGYVGRPLTIRAVAQGSGATAGTVTIQQGSLVNGTPVYDTSTPAAGELDLAGTNLAADSASFAETGNRFWQLVLTGASASTTFRFYGEIG